LRAFQVPRALFFALVLLLALAGGALAQARTPLVIVTDTGEHRFEVELARSPEDRARGLMFRRSLPENQGMLFDFARDEDIGMWMQNTYLPLDMVFIRADGTVARVERSATPFSTEIIRAGQPVRAVLELLGGTARRIGLKPGDRVRHPVFAAGR